MKRIAILCISFFISCCVNTLGLSEEMYAENNDYEYNDDYLEYGFDGYLLKPIDKDKLFELIDKYLK